MTRYEGPFERNSMNGPGKIIYKSKDKDGKDTDVIIPVVFKEGKLQNEKDLPEDLHKIVFKKKDDNAELPKEDHDHQKDPNKPG